MQTIHLRHHSVNDRRRHQCARPGWRPRRRRPDRQFAADVAAAIRRHRAAGHIRWLELHEYTPDLHLQAMIQQHLDADEQ